MKKIVFYAFIILSVLQSCDGVGNSSAVLPADFKTDKLVENATNLKLLVTKEDIASVVGNDTNKISIYEKDYDDDISSAMLLFTWKNDQELTVKVGGRDQKLDGSSSMGVGRLMRLTGEEFNKIYTAKSKAELNADINKIVTDTSINTDIAIWEAKDMAANAMSQKFEKLENVGSVAYWETPMNALHVLANDIAFTVSTNLNKDPAESKQKAVALANLIFKK